MEPKVGETYRVTHVRKGTFVAKVIERDDEFTTLELVDGAPLFLSMPDVEQGESFGVRNSLTTFEPVD